MKLNVALIGGGRIAPKHIEAIKLNPKYCKLVAICEKNLFKRRKFNKLRKVNIYSDIDKMLSNERIDLVSILTESGNHFKHIKKVSKYKKNIVVEKPLCLSKKHAISLQKLSKSNKINIFVVKQNRFNKAIINLKKAVSNKRFGKIFSVSSRVRWARLQSYYDMDKWRGTEEFDGGVYANQASHHLDMILSIMGDVKSVYANGIKAIAKIQMEDTVIVNIKFKNGGLGYLEATTATRPKDLEGSLSVLGTKGTAVIGGYAMNRIDEWVFTKRKKEDKLLRKTNIQINNVYGHGHSLFYKKVIDNIIYKKKFPIKLIDAIKVSKLIEAIKKSIKFKKIIYL
tara:strand:- start:202 stop:1221 length:1020 start_codon:yes stop_codon:yes gene_type:complete